MKKFSLILSMAFFLNANCQDIAKKLQSKTWFVSEGLLKSEKTFLTGEKPSVPVKEVKLLSDGTLRLDVEGRHDFRFVCPYELKKNMIKIHYMVNTASATKKEEEVAHYYKISELADGKGFELIPVTAAEFR